MSTLYLKPVRWVLLSKTAVQPTMVIMSPWEANCAYSRLRTAESVSLHQYCPRMALSQAPLDALTLYTHPPLPSGCAAPTLLVVQLNLVAGQLWLSSYEQYVDVCRYLGVSYEPHDGKQVEADGFEGKTAKNPDCHFEKSPVSVFAAVLRARAGDLKMHKTDSAMHSAGDQAPFTCTVHRINHHHKEYHPKSGEYQSIDDTSITHSSIPHPPQSTMFVTQSLLQASCPWPSTSCSGPGSGRTAAAAGRTRACRPRTGGGQPCRRKTCPCRPWPVCLPVSVRVCCTRRKGGKRRTWVAWMRALSS